LSHLNSLETGGAIIHSKADPSLACSKLDLPRRVFDLEQHSWLRIFSSGLFHWWAHTGS
jgi:hypothetical protein